MMEWWQCPHCGNKVEMFRANEHRRECRKKNPEEKFTIKSVVKRLDKLERLIGIN